MPKLDGKIAFITGAGRGQGRAHAVRLATEGADIIAVDICEPIASVPYALATPEDLAETRRAVEALDRRIVTAKADVRDASALAAALGAGVAELGGLDIVIANAGIAPHSPTDHPDAYRDVIDINLTGVLNTVEAAIPALIERGTGGAIVLCGSTAGVRGVGGSTRGGLGYSAAKHGVVGLMRNYANNLAAQGIRVNVVLPTGVRTPMALTEAMGGWMASQPGLFDMSNLLPVDLVEPEDVAAAVAWLVSDDARYITGVQLPVDAGFLNKR
jgi:SDR family mycofactocin-dependent oxidoreductase